MSKFLDRVIHEAFKNRKERPDVYEHVTKARKFVLDSNMSAHLADLSHRGISDVDDQERDRRIHELRRLARCPFEHMWIEYDSLAYIDRVKEVYAPPTFQISPDASSYCGYLLNAVPLSTSSVGMVGGHFVVGGPEKPLKIIMLPFSFHYQTIEGPYPKHEDLNRNPKHPLVITKELNDLAIGVPGFKLEEMSIMSYKDAKESVTRGLVQESSGFIRTLWAFLATINDVPTYRTEVKAPRGVQRRHNYQAFMDHTVITLSVPLAQAVRTLTNNIEVSRRRGHEVRGHWRMYHRGEGALCARDKHQWGAAENNEVRCTRCPAWKTWVPDHVRGDASLGWVTHDYVVEHKDPHVEQPHDHPL